MYTIALCCRRMGLNLDISCDIKINLAIFSLGLDSD